MNSSVKEIAVYRNGCFISRTGTVKLQKGRHSVVFDTLPQTLDPSTLTLSLPENLSGSNVQVEFLDEEKRDEILADLNRQIKTVRNRIEAKNSQIEMWKSNADFSSRQSLDIEEMSSYIEKLPERLEKIYLEINDLEEELKDLQKQLKEKEKEANTVLVKADVEAGEDGEYPFAVRYLDHNAGWYPAYEIHTSEDNDLNILLKGKITQNTSEDLSQVKVRLYSGNPAVSGDIPILEPARLNFYVPRPRMMGGGAMMKASMSMNMAMDMAAPEEAMDEEVMLADVSGTYGTSVKEDTMTEYELSGLWDVSSGKEISVDIETKTVPCRYHVVAIPKLDDCAYLAAEVDTSSIEELLATNTKVYHKGTYIGEIWLNPDLNEEKYDISLGRDESIRLRRDQKKKYTSNVLLKNQKKTEYEYELKVTSAKNKTCSVTLIDQLPISMDKTITVEIDDISGAKKEEDTGKLTWEFELEPSAGKAFTLAYTVSWPKDRQLNI